MSKVKVHFIGNLGKDPEVRTVGEVKVAKFTVGVSNRVTLRSGEQETKTKWMNVEAWRSLAEVSEKYLKKGSKVFIEGSLEDNTYEKDGQTKSFEFVAAQTIEILNKLSDDQERTSDGNSATDTGNQAEETDDLPF